MGLSVNLELGTCKADALLLEPHLQSIFALVVLEMGLANYLLRLASNHDPSDISLLSS
jgi:hypothetical protein